ncbi:o-succinylbenzoate synthase [Infirmifilum sp. SLHALR2]|nr:MAG: o-succinylbenzoate synthase [Thermofilum sp. NZ13]
MEIRKVDIYLLEMKLKEEFRTSFGGIKARPVVLVRVEEKGGEEGWGELVAEWGPWYSYETFEVSLLVLKKFIVPLLMESDTRDPEEFLRLASRVRGYPMAKTAVEEALVDLSARLRKIPVAEVLGGRPKDVEAGVSIGIKPNIKELLDEVKLRLDEGYRRVKIKIEPGFDVKPVSAVRKEFGDIPLQVDANGAYSIRDLQIFEELDKQDLLMIEQPFAWDDLLAHRVLARKISTPICLDESIASVQDLVIGWMLGSLEVVNVKPARVGGVTVAKRMLDIALELGIGAWIGGMLETGVGRAFLVALASHPAVSYPNDISASNRYWDEDIVEPPWTLTSRGTIEVPNKPGLGEEVLTDRIEKMSREKWSVSRGTVA